MKKRAMKKRIPKSIYCDHCPWHQVVWWDTTNTIEKLDGDYSMYIDPEGVKKRLERFANNPYKHKREECQFRDTCKDDCSQCKERVSYCKYLNYTEYGQYPLGDMVKVDGCVELAPTKYSSDFD